MSEDEIRETATRMFEAAKDHGNRYLLPRRICLNGAGRSGRSGDPGKDMLYDAAHWLVAGGYARWIDPTSSMKPGIELTLHGLTDYR